MSAVLAQMAQMLGLRYWCLQFSLKIAHPNITTLATELTRVLSDTPAVI